MNRHIGPTQVFNATVSGTSPVQSTKLDVRTMRDAAFQINVGAGLTATFQLMGSVDGVTYFDLGAIIAPVSGSAATVGWADRVAVPFVAIQITPSSGSGAVVITGSAKGE